MKKLSMKSKVLATVIGMSMLSVVTINSHATMTSNNQSDNRSANMEQRAKNMLANSVAAAKAPISATQAVVIAQQQIKGSTVMAVHYRDKMRKKSDNGYHKNSRSTTTDTPSYHLRLIDSNDKRYHIQIDAKTGKVLSKQQHDKRKGQQQGHRSKHGNAGNANHANNQASLNQPQPLKPSITLTQAMNTAANQIGGEAVSGRFGKMGMRHGKHGHRGNMGRNGGKGGHHGKGMMGKFGKGQPSTQNGERPPIPPMPMMQSMPPMSEMGGANGQMPSGERPTPNYHIQVVKNAEVHFVKVDGQTGKIIDSKTEAEMKADFDKRRKEWKEMREQRKMQGYNQPSVN